MKLIYVDESGDAGVEPGSSPYYILAGLLLDSSYWKEFYHQIEDFRRQIRQKFGADYGEFKGSQIFMHQGGAYKLQLKPVELQWIYDNLIALIFDTNISRIIVAQSKLAFRSRHPSQKPETLKKDLRLLTWEAFLSKVEQQLINECNQSGKLVTGVTYIDGKHDKYVYQISQSICEKV